MSVQAQALHESQVTLPDECTTAPDVAVLNVKNCPHCEYSSSNKHYLRQHIDLVHTTERPFKCPFCDYAGKRSHSLKEHLIVHSDERPYQCTQCNAKFRKKGHLTNHYRMHSEAQTFVCCPLCGSSAFSCRDELYTHLRLTHEDKIDTEVFCCGKCSYATTIKGNLHVHEMTHPDFRNIVLMKPKLPPKTNIILKCSECGFETNQRKKLEQHVLLKHLDGTIMQFAPAVEGEKPVQIQKLVQRSAAPKAPVRQYKCTECGLVTTDQKRLIMHVLEHRRSESQDPNAKPKHTVVRNQGTVGQYKCMLCEYYTDTQRTLKAHMWKHSGHQGLQYPTFQNGPLSVYDDTPLAAKNFVKVSTQNSVHTVPVNIREPVSPMKIQAPHSEGIIKNSIVVSNNTDVSVAETNEVSKVTTSPRVIVQSVSQPQNIGAALYQRSLSSHENSATSDEEMTTSDGTKQSLADKIVEVSSEDPLDVMTAVCEAVERQPVEATSTQETVHLDTDNYSATEKTAATLLSLLRQGPNVNPACPTEYQIVGDDGEPVIKRSAVDLEVAGEEVVSQEGAESDILEAETVSSDSGQASDTATTSTAISKPKQGICSSLLAVIEQLRERQAEDASIGRGTRRKRKRESKPAIQKDMLEFADMEESVASNVVIAYRCKPCQYDTESAAAITEHIRQHREMGKVVDESYGGIASMVRVTFNCKACQFFTLSNKEMKKHLIIHQVKASSPDIDVSPDDFNTSSEALQPDAAVTGTIYRCKLCHYRSSASLMKQHMKMHKSKKPHECSLCDYVATGSSNLQDHMIKHCKLRQYQCKRCPAVFNYKSQLRAHTRIHEDGQAFYCEHCGYVTSYFDSFHDHLALHTEVISSFTCIACRESFSDLVTLQKHMKDVCEEVKKLHKTQPYTNSVSSRPTSLKTTKSSTATASEKTPTSDLQSSVNNTSESEDGSRTLKCDQCEFVALSVRSLKSHLKRHVNDKRYIQQPLEQYKCNMCGYTCHHMPSLKSHMWRHANDSNFSYSFTNLLTESTTPTDSDGKPLITLRCCQCGFETLDKSELDTHMKTHWDIIKKTFDVGVQT